MAKWLKRQSSNQETWLGFLVELSKIISKLGLTASLLDVQR